MTTNKIFAFSLYCEGNGYTKAFAFVSIRPTEQEARTAAMNHLQQLFPSGQGWGNYQLSMIEIPEERVLLLAKEYEQNNK